MLKRKEKEEIIDKLANSLSKSSIVIATDYRGLTAKEMVKLRKSLYNQGIDYQVAKNTLTKFAAEKAGKPKLGELLTGPLAIAFGYEDAVKTAKTLNDYIRTSSSTLKIKGGMLGDRLVTTEDISNLATLPPREVLIAQLVSQLWSPIQAIHNVISAPLKQFSYILQSRIRQIEGGENVG